MTEENKTPQTLEEAAHNNYPHGSDANLGLMNRSLYEQNKNSFIAGANLQKSQPLPSQSSEQWEERMRSICRELMDERISVGEASQILATLFSQETSKLRTEIVAKDFLHEQLASENERQKREIEELKKQLSETIEYGLKVSRKALESKPALTEEVYQFVPIDNVPKDLPEGDYIVKHDLGHKGIIVNVKAYYNGRLWNSSNVVAVLIRVSPSSDSQTETLNNKNDE